MDLSVSGQGKVAVVCKQSNEFLFSIKRGEFLGYLWNREVLNKESFITKLLVGIKAYEVWKSDVRIMLGNPYL